MQKSWFGGRAFARTFALALLALCAEVRPSLGQLAPVGTAPGEPRIQVGVGGGVSVPISDTKSSLQNGVDGTGFVLLNVLGGGLPAIRFSFTYDRFDFKPRSRPAATGRPIRPTRDTVRFSVALPA